MAGNALVDYATEHLLEAVVHGYCFHSCFWVPFGSPNEPAEWFDPTPFKDVTLEMTGGAGLGEVKILTQQLRTGD